MSHGGGHGSNAAEPDLTAMLDVVMQMLMYFIMCANFLGEQFNEDIKLPPLQSAKPLIQGEGEILFLNINRDGKTFVVGNPEAMNIGETDIWLKNRADEAEANYGKEAWGKKVSLVLRADRGANYGDVFQVLQKCKMRGFRQFKVRGLVGGGG